MAGLKPRTTSAASDTLLFPSRSHPLADQERRVGAGARPVFLGAAVVDLCHVEVAVLVHAHAVTPHMPPGKSPHVPQEYWNFPLRSYLRTRFVPRSAAQRYPSLVMLNMCTSEGGSPNRHESRN